jgi:hypothetical protein
MKNAQIITGLSRSTDADLRDSDLIDPVLRAGDRFLPTGIQLLTLFCGQCWLKFTIDAEFIAQLGGAFPETDRQPSQESGTESGGFNQFWDARPWYP